MSEESQTISDLSEAERSVLDAARDFTRDTVVPHAERWEKDRRFPREAFLEAAGRGLTGLIVPHSDGGQGLSVRAMARVMEVLAA